MTAIGTHADLCAFFAQEALPPFEQTGWDDFRNRFTTPAADLAKPLSELPADYSRGTVTSSWRDTACKIGRIVLMIILFPWGLYAGTKYLFQRLVMLFVFPLQNRVMQTRVDSFNPKTLDLARQEIEGNLNNSALNNRAEHEILLEQLVENTILMKQLMRTPLAESETLSKGLDELLPLLEEFDDNKPEIRSLLIKQKQEMQAYLNQLPVQETNPVTPVKKLTNPYLVRQVILEKEGRRYRALMVATAHSLKSRNWVLQAPGNGMPIENCAGLYALYCTHDLNASLLIVQGPGAGDNDGEIPTTNLGEPFELALSCIETHFKAKQIILSGYSLGGASIGQAIEQHTFDTEKHKYIVVRQMTFDNLSNVGYNLFSYSCLSCFANCLIKWTGCDIDNVEASRILQEKQIVEIVVQAGEDEVIPYEASLSRALQNKGVNGHKIFEQIPDAGHGSMLLSLTPLLQKHPCGVAFLNS